MKVSDQEGPSLEGDPGLNLFAVLESEQLKVQVRADQSLVDVQGLIFLLGFLLGEEVELVMDKPGD